jgi:hypothetical protein
MSEALRPALPVPLTALAAVSLVNSTHEVL